MENNYSYLTAISRTNHSVPVRWLKAQGLLKGRILDYGCGRGFDTIQLSEDGFECECYDPHYQPIMPTGRFDTIICIYVLNVLLKREQNDVVADIQDRLNVDGKAYFAVRRDIRKEGWRWYDAKRQTYQENATLSLPIIYKTHKFCIYELDNSLPW